LYEFGAEEEVLGRERLVLCAGVVGKGGARAIAAAGGGEGEGLRVVKGVV
jgi:hypothetical protein